MRAYTLFNNHDLDKVSLCKVTDIIFRVNCSLDSMMVDDATEHNRAQHNRVVLCSAD